MQYCICRSFESIPAEGWNFFCFYFIYIASTATFSYLVSLNDL